MAAPARPITDAERWFRERYARTPERDALFTTLSGEPIQPLYTEQDLPAADAIGLPGEFPYTRGVYPSMYRGRLWTMRQFAGFGTAEETNARFRYLLDHGQTGLSTAFDMPSLMGYDSDHVRSLGEVGREVGDAAGVVGHVDGVPGRGVDRVVDHVASRGASRGIEVAMEVVEGKELDVHQRAMVTTRLVARVCSGRGGGQQDQGTGRGSEYADPAPRVGVHECSRSLTDTRD